jgi:hypothetical protein
MLRSLIALAILLFAPGLPIDLVAQQARTTPDLQGFWTNATATPLQRPPEFADKPTLTEEEAAAFEQGGLARLLKQIPQADLVTAADLNETYLDTPSMKLAAGRRTSLIVDPPNGRLPALVPAALKRAEARPKRSYENPETFTLDERCLLSTATGGSNATPPIVPNAFGLNFYQIVQTSSHVMIFSELVHDARVIRIGGQHPPAHVQLWLGDSIGRWEGDTLVVDTTNFSDKSRFRGASERLHVIERFTRTSPATIRYRVTVDDPDMWAAPWTAEIPFNATDERIFEFACHEGNYSLGNALRAAQLEHK